MFPRSWLRLCIGILSGVPILAMAFAAPAVHAQSAVTWTMSAQSVTEGNFGTTTPMTFTVTLSGPSSTDTTFFFHVIGGTALGGGSCSTGNSDFELISGNRTIPAGQTTTTFQLTICGDNWDENDETIFLEADRTSGTPSPAAISVTATIHDDDTGGLTGPPFISVNSTQVVEGNAGTTTQAIFTVSLSDVSQQPATARFSVLNLLDTATIGSSCAVSGVDVVGISNLLVTIPAFANPPQVQVPVTVCGDNRDESNESFHVQLTQTTSSTCFGAGEGTCLGTGVILDDEPSFAIGPAGGVSVTEGDTSTVTATLTLSVSGDNAGSTASVRTVDGTARGGTACTAGVDYISLNQLVQVPAGSSSAPVQVTICPDTTDEPDETFTVQISSSDGLVSNASTTVTIIDNDAPPTVSIGDTRDFEEPPPCPAGQLCFPVEFIGFPVTLSAPSGKQVTVSYATRELVIGTPGTFATAGTSCSDAGADFLSTTGTVQFNPGDTRQFAYVQLCPDNVDELNEQFQVVLSNPRNAVLGDAVALGTILNNDNPTLAVNDLNVSEGSQPNQALIRVSLSHQSLQPITFNFATRSNTATPSSVCTLGVDYIETAGSRTISAGDVAIDIPVTICGDFILEPNKDFFLDISLPATEFDTTIARPTGVVTIFDDDRFVFPGVASLAPVNGTVGVHDHLVFDFGWQLPNARPWRQLNTLQLRIRQGDEVLAWVRWTESVPFGTFQLINPNTGEAGPAGAPGNQNVLAERGAKLFLERSSVKGSGPTGSSVSLTLDMQFGPQAAGRTFIVEVAATDDQGNGGTFAPVGTLTVLDR